MNITNVESKTKHKPSSSYFKEFAKTFEDIYKGNSEAGDSFENYLRRYLVVITAKFKPLAVGIKDEPFYLKNNFDVEHRPGAMNEFGRSMFRINKYLLGSHLGNKIRYQPRGYAFLDFAGTKYGTQSQKIDVHVHSLVLMHPTTERLFKNVLIMPEQFSTDRMKPLYMKLYDPSLIDVNVPEDQRLERLISYLSKGVQNIGCDDGDYWTVLPAIRVKTKAA